MKNNKIKILSLGIVFFICLSNIANFIPVENFNQSLKISAGEITIVTPENKTYIAPMSGYYPATYGFENDEDGSFPAEWIDDSTGGLSNVSVVSEMAGHKKVLFYDSFGTSYSRTSINLSSPQTTGSIEYYVYRNPAGFKGFEIALRNSTGDYALRIGIDYNFDGKFIWRTSSSTAAEFGAGKFLVDTWFHIRIDFDLVAKKFDIYLDGVKEVDQEDFFYDIKSLEQIAFYQTYSTGGGFWYIDALSFSWHPNYNIGENLNEGLLLSFENSTILDWVGYSLDGQVNKTILGNTTIPMLEDGFHTVQIFGNNSLGTIYQSSIQHFSVDTGSPEITITTPSQNDFFGVVPPNFEISILKPNITNIWYTLDNGITNNTSPGLTGTIDQIEWNKILADVVTIRFYANDTLGFEGNAEVTIKKDLNHPQSLISQEGLTFTITADDGSGSGVSVIKYRINGSSWIDYTVPFSLEYGIWNITYQAIDAVGNVESENTLIINLRDPGTEEEPGGIPSYPLFSTSIFLLGTIMAIIYFLRKKHFKYRK